MLFRFLILLVGIIIFVQSHAAIASDTRHGLDEKLQALKAELENHLIVRIELYAMNSDLNDAYTTDSTQLEQQADYKLTIKQFMSKSAALDLMHAVSQTNIKETNLPNRMDFEIKFFRKIDVNHIGIQSICIDATGQSGLIDDHGVIINDPLLIWVRSICQGFLKVRTETDRHD